MKIISKNNDLPITKKQFIKGVIDFIYKYKRLPYENEDSIEIEVKNDEDGIENKTYRANRYICSFYKNQNNMTKELLKGNIVTYKMISNVTDIPDIVIKNIMEKNNKSVETPQRRKVHMFFNKDFYEGELGKYNSKCAGCKKLCKQHYYVSIITCPKYEKK